MNLISLILIHITTKKNYYCFLEIISSFLIFIFFYTFKKIYDEKLKILFAEKYKYEKLFLHFTDFINGLNCYHMTFKNTEILYADKNISILIEDIYKNCEFYLKDEQNFLYKNDLKNFINNNNI